MPSVHNTAISPESYNVTELDPLFLNPLLKLIVILPLLPDVVITFC